MLPPGAASCSTPAPGVTELPPSRATGVSGSPANADPTVPLAAIPAFPPPVPETTTMPPAPAVMLPLTSLEPSGLGSQSVLHCRTNINETLGAVTTVPLALDHA